MHMSAQTIQDTFQPYLKNLRLQLNDALVRGKTSKVKELRREIDIVAHTMRQIELPLHPSDIPF